MLSILAEWLELGKRHEVVELCVTQRCEIRAELNEQLEILYLHPVGAVPRKEELVDVIVEEECVELGGRVASVEIPRQPHNHILGDPLLPELGNEVVAKVVDDDWGVDHPAF